MLGDLMGPTATEGHFGVNIRQFGNYFVSFLL